MLYKQQTLNCRGKLISLERPLIMGVVNVTPDSFYDGGRFEDLDAAKEKINRHVQEGADIIDFGGLSSRPGALTLDAKTEISRLDRIITWTLQSHPDAIISIDTYRSEVARHFLDKGVHIINDIGGGKLDDEMWSLIAEYNAPYILMHMRGNPETMKTLTTYENVTLEVLDELIESVGKLRELGVKDIIIDPGFGFAKTRDQNFEMLSKLHVFRILEIPILVGISRKSMIYKTLNISSDEALNGTTALHMVALEQGATILRVHDVMEAKQAIELWLQLSKYGH